MRSSLSAKKKNLKNFSHKFIYLIFFTITMVLILSSCNKKPEALGLDLVDNNPLGVEFSDTISIVAFSVFEDSARTDELSTVLLGSIFDPVFGITTANIYSQLSLTTLTPDFGTNPQCDSMVLAIDYSGYYGDTLTELTFKIFEVVEEINFDSAYYSINNLEIDQTELANYTTAPRPNDSVYIDSVPLAPHLKIPMNTILGDKILSAPQASLEDNVVFKEFINGIYISTDPVTMPGDGSILYLSFFSSISHMELHFHNDDEDSLVYYLSINNIANARFGNYNHYEYADGAPEFKAQINGDTALGQQLVYCQAMAGIKTKVTFPHIMEWVKDEKIAINEAQLIFHNNDPQNILLPPESLSLLKINDDGSVDFLADQFQGDYYFDGIYTDERYRFRITQYLQKVLNGDQPNNGIYLLVPGASLKANRVVLNGFETPSKQITLELIYTRLNL